MSKLTELAQYIVSLKPVILDTETTGLGHDDEIVSIGIVDIDGNVLLDTLVKPTIAIPNEVVNIHGVTNEMVKDSPSYFDIMGLVEFHMKDKAICIYNAQYDLRMLKQSAKAHGKKPVAISHYECVMEMYAEFWGDWNDYHQSYRWQKLGQAAKQCGLKPTGLHHAVNDAEMTRQVLLYMAK